MIRPAPIRNRLPLSVLMIALLCGVCTPRAVAQGTSGMLPDPITSRELMRYADRLVLSDQQRLALDALHQQYREEFRSLRESEIEQFLKDMNAMQGRIPERRQFEDMFSKGERLLSRIASIDERFLSRIDPILTDEQRARLPRVRLARERARIRAGQMMPFGGEHADLSDLVLDIDMTMSERQAIDPMLAQYEQRLTAMYRSLFELSIGMYTAMLDVFEEHDITDDDLQDPAKMGKLMTVFQEMMQRIFGGIAEQTAEIRTLGRRSLATMTSAMSEDTGRALRNAYYRRSYPSANFALALPVDRHYQAAMSMDEIDEDQRSRITAAAAQTRQSLDRILDDAVKEIEQFGAGRSMFSFDPAPMQEHQERLSALRERADALNESARAGLHQLLGESVAERVKEVAATLPADEGQARRRTVVTSVGDNSVSIGVTTEPAAGRAGGSRGGPGSSPDPLLPDAIGTADLATYAEILALDPEHRMILDELHADYLRRFDEATAEPFSSLREAQAARGRASQGEADIAQSIRRLWQSREAAREAIRAADAALLDDIRITVGGDDDALERIRMTRQRQEFSRGRSSFMRQNRAGTADLSHILRVERIAVSDRAAHEMLLEYERELTRLMGERSRAVFARDRAVDELAVRMTEDLSEAERFEEVMRYQQEMELAERPVRDHEAAISDLNQRTIERLVAAMSHDDAGERLLHAWRQRAYPNVYRDTSSVESHLTTAMRLEDVTADQRSRLMELAAEHRPHYARLTEQMFDTVLRMPDLSFGLDSDQDAWREFSERQNALSRLRFERNELNARTGRLLASILTPEQIERIGPLPDPAAAPTAWWQEFE